jgi:hypothetical protein
MAAFDSLRDLIGAERSVGGVAQALYLATTELNPPAVGALHVTCADETEHECAAAFQKGFVQFTLPALKSLQQAAMRLANLGGRYDWGAIRIAEEHFATRASHEAWKLIVVKVNAHVGRVAGEDGVFYGRLHRYGTDSACCGALAGMMEGGHEPALEDLRVAFRSEGEDRLSVLLDEEKVHPARRALDAALVSARLQGRSALLDIQDYQPATPTLWLVVPCVTVNQPGTDTEILVGTYVADGRGDTLETTYLGLGDDPLAYRLEAEHGRLRVVDPHVGRPRAARNHREMALATWRKVDLPFEIQDERIHRFKREVEERRHQQPKHSHSILRGLLLLLGEIAPGPAAVLLFAEGLAGIHHAYRVQQLSKRVGEKEHAGQILREVHERVDRLDADEAAVLVELLMAEYQ